MFEAAVDQADGLRRLFSPRVPSSVIPIGCSAPAAACRGYAASLLDALTRIGFTPMLFDRLDLDHELGEVQAHSPVNRLLLLEEPVRLARWLRGRQSSMLLLLSHHRDALPPQYATIKSIVGGHGLRQFATLFVDAPSPDEAVQAHYRLATCARRFLDVEIEPLLQGAVGSTAPGAASLARLQRFETGIDGFLPLDPLVPGVGPGLSH